MQTAITVLGAGSWGTALAILIARNGHPTLLWGHDPEHIRKLDAQRENRRYLSGFPFPEHLQVTADLHKAAAFSNLLLISVPSKAFASTLCKLKPFLTGNTKLTWATKGFCPENGPLLHQCVETLISRNIPSAVLSGPTFAREVAADLPTAITIASEQSEFAKQFAGILHNQRFRVYTSTDITGVQVGGAVKNVLAIAAGIADGLGFGANTRTALITRGINEMMRLGIKMGGKPETFMGLAGMGDLILTCTDNQSRNRRFGLALGKGTNREQIYRDIDQEIEGISATRITYQLAHKYALDMPIIEQTYKVLNTDITPLEAVRNLLQRERKAEMMH